MNNILFISTYPFPQDKGAFQHAYVYLKILAAHFNVYGIFFLPANVPQPSRHESDRLLGDLGVLAYDFCHLQQSMCKNRFIYAMRELFAFPYQTMRNAVHAEGYKLINEYVVRFSINLIHYELFHYTGYAFHTPRHVKQVVVYHDLYHRIDLHHIRYHKHYFGKFLLLPTTALKKYAYEHMLEKHIDLKIFLNPVEMSLFPDRSVHVPHVVNPEIQYRAPRDTSMLNILFLGGYDHPPNRVSFHFMVDQLLPRLIEQTRRFSLMIVGKGTEKFAPYLARSNSNGFVKIRGFVSDINAVFSDVDIALLPIMYGGGIKTKVIEAMAAGVPVVTTPRGLYGMENLPSNCVGVGRNAGELVKEMATLMNDHSLRLERSRNAIRYIKRHHSMEQLPEKLLPLYAGLQDRSERSTK